MLLRLLITLLAAVGIITHLIFPAVNIDFVSLCLLVIAAAPWLAPIVKSLELPGGFKIELQDIQRATRKAELVTVSAEYKVPFEALAPGEPHSVSHQVRSDFGDRLAALESLAAYDPNIALVGLRIEIERSLQTIARSHELPWNRQSAGQLLRRIQDAAVLPADLVSAVREMIQFGNQAAHGATVSPDAAKWAVNYAPEILSALAAHYRD